MRFGRQQVLRDVDLKIPRGQTVAVIGESGCGKTVLLKTIIGLLRPTRGAVRFDGQDLAELSERELTRQRIRFGFLFQQAALFDSMTIAQNIGFPLAAAHAQAAGRDPPRSSPRGWPRWGCRRTAGQEAGRAFRAGCGSGWAWPGPWPWSRKSCSTTSPPPAWTRS